jgi:hypothetical protein
MKSIREIFNQVSEIPVYHLNWLKEQCNVPLIQTHHIRLVIGRSGRGHYASLSVGSLDDFPRLTRRRSSALLHVLLVAC